MGTIIGSGIGISFAKGKGKSGGGPPPPVNRGLSFEGVSSYLQMPAVQMDTMEFDVLIDVTQPQTYACLLDARSGLANGHINRSSNVNAGWSKVFVNGVEAPSKLWTDFGTGQRLTLNLQAVGTFTDNVTLFTNNTFTGNTFCKLTLYTLTCYLAGNVVAKYDASTGTMNDQSGNGYNATLTGGTWN